MPVDLKLLRQRGGTADALKEKFTLKNIKPGGKIAKLIELSSSRINDGIQQNLKDARIFWAIDRAFEVSQRQITYTLVEGLLSRNPSNEQVLSAVESWGLKNMLSPVIGKNGKAVCNAATGEPLGRLDLPTFFNIFVPIVHAYTKIRWAKLFNDRDLYPFYKYEPLKMTLKSRIKTEIVTDRIQRMSTDMGYRSDERQSALQTLLYGVCLNFPMEDWYREAQVFLEEADGKIKEKEVVIKEGVRNAIPHPSRMFYDLAHNLPSFNTDTGCEWGGYWDITRYRDIAVNGKYWNVDTVKASYGKNNWMASGNWKLFQELFPCRFPFPNLDGIVSGSGAGEQDRINRASDQYYTRSMEDQAVTLVPLFQRLIPKEWDLYDYDRPVWHRFVFAGEDTVIYGSPLAYSPILAYLYDYDQNRAFNTSLGLELLPWQDMISNYLTQYLLSVKQNLAKVVFWNTDIMEQKDIDQITNLGEKIYRGYNFIPFSQKENSWLKESQREAFHSVNFPNQNTQEIAAAINMQIGIMERMLGFSSQEIGASAAHEESATEVSIKQANTSVRLDFTGGFLDEARHARKRQLYDAMMAYSNDEIFAEIGEMNDEKRKALEAMGFKVEEEEEGTQTKAGVRGSKKALILDGFASDRDGVDRISDSKIAATMIQTFQAMFSNPAIVEATGIKQLIEMFNQVLYYAGAPRDFRLRFEERKDVPEQASAIGQQLAELQKQVTEIAQQAGTQAGLQAGIQGGQEAGAQAANAIVSKEFADMGDAMREQVIVPLQKGQEQLGQAIVQLVQKLDFEQGRNAEQDKALQSILSILEASRSQPLPVVDPSMMAPPI